MSYRDGSLSVGNRVGLDQKIRPWLSIILKRTKIVIHG